MLRGAQFPGAFIGFCQSLTDLGKENTQLCQLQPKKGEKCLRNSCGIPSADTQVHRDTGARSEKCGMLPSPYSSPHVTRGLCTAVPSPFSCYALLPRKRLQGILKGKNHNVKNKASTEPGEAGMSESSDWESKQVRLACCGL